MTRIPHEHHWVGPDQFAPHQYCGLCSVPRHHEHHVHEKRPVSDCPDCIDAATAFLAWEAAATTPSLPGVHASLMNAMTRIAARKVGEGDEYKRGWIDALGAVSDELARCDEGSA